MGSFQLERRIRVDNSSSAESSAASNAAAPAWELIGTGVDHVEIRFVGHLDTESGVASAKIVAEQLRKGRMNLMLDVHEMAGYDRGARVAWQEVLWPMRDRIKALVLIGGNSVVRMGGSVLAMFLGVPLKTRDDVERNGGSSAGDGGPQG